MRKIIITIGALIALAVAGCSSATSTHGSGQVGQAPINGGSSTSAPAAVPVPVNPVPILKATGATVPPGVVNGDHDVSGNRMAEGHMGYEGIIVYTAPSAAALSQLLATQTFATDDYNKAVVIPAKFAAILVSAWEDNGPHWAPGGTPAQIAKRVGGHLKTG